MNRRKGEKLARLERSTIGDWILSVDEFPNDNYIRRVDVRHRRTPLLLRRYISLDKHQCPHSPSYTPRLPDNPAICKIAFPGWSRIWRHTVTHLLLFDLVMLSSAHAHIPRSLQFGRCFRERNDRFENSLPTSTNRTNNREFYLIFHRDNSSISTSKAKKEEKRGKKDNDNNVFAEISQTVHEIFVLRRSHLHQRSWNFHGEK